MDIEWKKRQISRLSVTAVLFSILAIGCTILLFTCEEWLVTANVYLATAVLLLMCTFSNFGLLFNGFSAIRSWGADKKAGVAMHLMLLAASCVGPVVLVVRFFRALAEKM